MKNLIFIVVFLSPPFLKRLFLKWFCRARFGRKSRIGWFSAVVGRNIAMGDFSVVKPFTLIRCDGDVTMGDYSEISSFSIIYGCANFQIGDKCYIGPQTWINVSEDFVTGNGVGIGPRSMIFTHGSFLPYTEGYPVRFGKVTIGNTVWIPAGVFVQPGIEIGDNVLVNSRSVITKSLPAGQYVAGFPAKPIRPMDQVRKAVTPVDRDNIIAEILQHFISFLKKTDKGITVASQELEKVTLQSRRQSYEIVNVNSEGKISGDIIKSSHNKVIVLVNSPEWEYQEGKQDKLLVFDFTSMKTKYCKDHVHREFYMFLKMYYGIIFEYM